MSIEIIFYIVATLMGATLMLMAFLYFKDRKTSVIKVKPPKAPKGHKSDGQNNVPPKAQEGTQAQQSASAQSSVSSARMDNEGGIEVLFSPGYVQKLETAMQKALGDVVRSTADDMRKDLQKAAGEISAGNQDVVNSLKEFQDKLGANLQETGTQLQDRLANEFQQTIGAVKERDQQLVSAIDQFKNEAISNFQTMFSQAISSFDSDLSEIKKSFQEEIKNTVGGSLQSEVQSFHSALTQAREQTIQSLSNIYKETEAKKQEMEQSAFKEVQETKQRMIQNLNSEFDEVITRFLVENLGDALDLGKQEDYIFSALEQHKEDLIKDVS